MKSKFTFYGIITDYKRMNNSKNGNPKYWITLNGSLGKLEGVTATDASCGYEILNYIRNPRMIYYHVTPKGKIIIDNVKISK